ncbi:MAG: hypothetical protein N2422_04400 [Rhodobacteraceae bacterium]|nr:hypothetical protein [Paracoccaceae bacterium]
MRVFLAGLLALSGLSTAAVAGGMAEPVMEPETVAEAAATSGRDDWVVPLLLLVLIAVTVSNDGETPTPG